MSDIPSRRRRQSLNPNDRRIESWPLADTSKLPTERKELFERRYQALCGYMRGERLSELTRKWKVSRWEIKRLRDRCLKTHPDGRLWGFRALLPNIRLGDYLRSAPRSKTLRAGVGFGGALGRCLSRHPITKDKIYRHYLRKRQGANEGWVPIASSHKVFIESLREEGAAQDEYPFNTQYMAKRALARHLNTLFVSDLYAAVRAKYGAEAERALNTGTGTAAASAATLPYQRVQFDGHRIDGIYTLLVPHPQGGFIEIVIERPWLLLVIDVVTRNILGWHLSLNREYNQEDVLKCFRNAIEPWKRRPLTISGLSYHPTGAMPSGIFEKACWA